MLVSKPLHLHHALLASGDSNRTLTQGPLTLLINTMLCVLAAVKVLVSTWIFPEDTLTPRGGGDGPPKGHKEARCFITTSMGRSPSHAQKVTAARLLAPPSSQTAATKEHVARPPALAATRSNSWTGGPGWEFHSSGSSPGGVLCPALATASLSRKSQTQTRGLP